MRLKQHHELSLSSEQETGKLEPKRKPEDFGPGDGPK